MQMDHAMAMEIDVSVATEDHLTSMARLHAVCFRGEFAKHMGQRYRLAMLRPYVVDSNGIAIAATHADGQVAGMVTGGSRDIERQFARSVPKRFALRLIWGVLINREVRRTVWDRLSHALRARGGQTWRRSDVALPPGTAWLHVICIHPDARGSGLADRLLDTFIAECAAHGYQHAALWTSEDNVQAIRCYERNGWSVTSVDDSEVYMGREVVAADGGGASSGQEEGSA